MPRRKRRQQPATEGSWVIAQDSEPTSSASDLSDGSNDAANDGHRAELAKSGQRRRHEPLKAEPDLIMPTITTSTQYQGLGVQAARKRSRPHGIPSSEKHPPTKSDARPSSAARGDASDPEPVYFFLHMAWTEFCLPALKFLHHVLLHVYHILRPFLAFGVALFLIVQLGRLALHTVVAQSLAPLCAIPGVGYLNLPFCVSSQQSGPVEFDQLMNVQAAFEDVLDSSSAGVSLPSDMKRSESSIRDLKHVVQFSALPSRNELVFEFGGFIETARQASNDLIRFNSRVGRAVDHVISTNRWTLQVIDGVAERDASRGAVGRFFAKTVVLPFQTGMVSDRVLLDQYLRHTRAVEEQISDLILEAQALLAILQNLDDRLDIIHGVTTRDGFNVKGSRDELFSQLWTKLGGNRSSKKKHDDQLYLLKQVNGYRKVAWDHVTATMLKLQSMAAGLEDLRERVAAPEVVGYREDVPLRVHIDNIQLAVDRLYSQRLESSQHEREYNRRAIDRNEASAPALAISHG